MELHRHPATHMNQELISGQILSGKIQPKPLVEQSDEQQGGEFNLADAFLSSLASVLDGEDSGRVVVLCDQCGRATAGREKEYNLCEFCTHS